LSGPVRLPGFAGSAMEEAFMPPEGGCAKPGSTEGDA
jgi:hypothetical protein